MDFHQLDIRYFLQESIPSRFGHLNSLDFEDFIRYLFEVDGYDVQPGVQVGDLSNKILASKEDTSLVIQAFRKDEDELLGEAEIRKAIQAKTFYQTDQSWIVTTSAFTPEARQFAEEADIELWDWDSLYVALCQLFFEGKSHLEYLKSHPPYQVTQEKETDLKLKVKWQAVEGVSPDWYNLGITLTNPTERNMYLHLELPALIDQKHNQLMADQWVDGEFVAGIVYSGASIRTNALFSVSKLGDRPPGGRIVLTCHERVEVPLTYHLHARLQGQACFVVTYCYSRNSDEYRDMIAYRDEVLSLSLAGRCLIRFYYFFSPYLVKWAASDPIVDSLVRKWAGYIIPSLQKRVIKAPLLHQEKK